MATGLQAELKQSRPFKCLEEEAYLNIMRTAAVLEHGLAQALKAYGITPTQYNVLRILRGAGTEGLCRNEVGERLVRAVPDVTRLLDRMEELDLLSRHRGAEDRRYVSTRITRKGLELLARLDGQIGAIHHRRLGHLDRESLRTLVALLTEVRNPDRAGAARQQE
jgi:DNA-binding MarR family transcriptional regulator